MSFIYGIINLDKKAVRPEDISTLAQAVGYRGFAHHIYTDTALALGYSHHPERRAKAGIFRDKELLVLADIRIYNRQTLLQHFDFTCPEEAFAKV